ncbi:MAG: hypothetical protein HYV63_34635 [Candidatus Schekmanbacteria bacterium]|nr:hypothetical protein [Candidatus Schekmanbacteria bacterium]
MTARAAPEHDRRRWRGAAGRSTARTAMILSCLAIAGSAATGCGDEDESREYLVSLRGHAAEESFVIRLADLDDIMAAEAELARSEESRHLHPHGRLLPGAGGFNTRWSWHLDPRNVDLVEVSIELCDGSPAMVEENLSYWLGIGEFCPWDGHIARRLR